MHEINITYYMACYLDVLRLYQELTISGSLMIFIHVCHHYSYSIKFKSQLKLDLATYAMRYVLN